MGNILLRLEKTNRNLYKNIIFRLQASEKTFSCLDLLGLFYSPAGWNSVISLMSRIARNNFFSPPQKEVDKAYICTFLPTHMYIVKKSTCCRKIKAGLGVLAWPLPNFNEVVIPTAKSNLLWVFAFF
jgi:hypothetical protein